MDRTAGKSSDKPDGTKRKKTTISKNDKVQDFR